MDLRYLKVLINACLNGFYCPFSEVMNDDEQLKCLYRQRSLKGAARFDSSKAKVLKYHNMLADI